MEEKKKGGKRLGAGRKPLPTMQKRTALTVFPKNEDLVFFGDKKKMAEKVIEFISSYGRNAVQPNTAIPEAPKVQVVQDAPLSFDALKSQITQPQSRGEWYDKIDAAQTLEQLEMVGRQIAGSGMDWRQKNALKFYGQQVAKQKFPD